MGLTRRKAHRSLRTILIIWFLLFSLVPLAFVTGYSVIKYEKAIDSELSERLRGNAREISVILKDLEADLFSKKSRYVKDPGLISFLLTENVSAIRNMGLNWLQSDFSSSLNFFNRDGRMLVSVFRNEKGGVKEFPLQGKRAVFLSEVHLEKLKTQREYAFVEFTENRQISLISFSSVSAADGHLLGYLEQVIHLDQAFLERLKERMKLEIALLRPGGQVAAATHPDLYVYKEDFFQEYIKVGEKSFFELNIRGNPHGFIAYPVTWGLSQIYLVLGASKVEAKAALKKVNYAFYSVVGAVIILIVFFTVMASRTLLKPLDDLVEAIGNVNSSDRPIEIPIKSDTEIGLLAESFNQMSRNVSQARVDLKKKIVELQAANQELVEAQARLIHSAKMVSLGQLVAGIAHELNNPIGFIYSNMNHLKDYSEKLIQLVEVAEKNPQEISELKEKLDLDYLKEDLPKLIKSCEDGARRTRDIVVGLRNFSRLEEAKLKEVNLHEEIEKTLNLLSGETKNRIQIVKDYGVLPPVSCFSSQINQVFMNILSNAIQAIKGNGNIWITTRLQKSPDGADFVRISFQDSGIGMTPQVMEKIFEPFFSTKGIGQGTGLGLSVSYGVIQNHGGDIQVKSEVGIGTEFVIRIPVKAVVGEKVSSPS